MDNDDLSLLYFKQVFPLHPDTQKFFSGAEKIVIVENNATSQFAKILKLHANVNIEKKINKYNGLPFSVEELVNEIKDIL